MLPVRGLREDDVGVREERERRPVAAAADTRHEIRALGRARIEVALGAGGLEVVTQELGDPRLVAGRVGRVETDEALEQLRDLGDGLRHLRRPSTTR